MVKGKVTSFVLLGLLAMGVIGITGRYLLTIIPVKNSSDGLFVLGFAGLVLGFVLLITLLINERRRREQTTALTMQQEIDRQLRLIDRNRRGSQGQRKALVNDTFTFVEELNQFITTSNYIRTKRALLEARHEFSELKAQQLVVKSKTKKRKQDTTQQLQLESDLTELTLSKLEEMTQVADREDYADTSGKEALFELLEVKSDYFQQEYQGLSPYFGSIATLLVYLNEQLAKRHLSKTEYMRHIEVLRHHFTRNDLLILFLYVLLMPSGCRLAVELVGSSFFGNLDEVGQNTFVEAPEIFRMYLEDVFAENLKTPTNKHQRTMTRYLYEAKQRELTKTYRNRKTAINRVLSGEYYVKNENGQVFLSLVDKLNLY